MPHKKTKEYVKGLVKSAGATAKRTVRDAKEGVKVVGEGLSKLKKSGTPFNPFLRNSKKDPVAKRTLPPAKKAPTKSFTPISESVKKRNKQIKDAMK